MRNRKGIDDLEYLAELGFKQVPEARTELKKLKRRVRKRYLGGASVVVGLLAILVVGAGVTAAYLYIDKASRQVLPPESAAQSPARSVPAPKEYGPVELDTVSINYENFVQPRRVQVRPAPAPPVYRGQDTLSIVELQRGSLPPLPDSRIDERRIKFIINSPVMYIHELKVSDYRRLYFKKDRYVNLNGNGLSADQAIPSSGPASHLRQEAPVYLHEQLAQALGAIRKGQYDVASAKLLDLETYTKNDINCNFYLGLCFYYRKNYAKAVERFDACVHDLNNAFLQESEYYKALALLELGKTEEAVALLRRIADDGEFYTGKARTVLEGL